MKNHLLSGVFILFTMLILIPGCMEPPVKEPTVSVQDIALSDVSLQTMTVNTTVVIFNPNAVGAKLSKVAFDVYYLDKGLKYLGHGEQSTIEVKNNGNTTVTIPVTIGNVPAFNALGSLVRKGSLTLNVNGSAFIDVKVTSFEKRFEQSKQFPLSEFESLLPVTSFNLTDTAQQLGGFLNAESG
jgi:LEA14-like dessication related protein